MDKTIHATKHTPAQMPPTGQPPSAPSVLLVDDQPARLLACEAVLAGVGVNCVRALSGEEALKQLLKQEFAVIVLDVSMPGMDGFETARPIRQHPRMERTPIIFVTGVHISELDRLTGYEVGAIDYISLPIVPEILRSKVALLVELYHRRAELSALNRELEDAVAIVQQVRVSLLVSHRLSQLLPRPLRGRMRCYVKVNQSTAVMFDDDEHVQDLERAGHRDTEITRNNGPCMISEKG